MTLRWILCGLLLLITPLLTWGGATRTGVIVKNGVVTNMILLPDEWTGKPGEWQPESGELCLIGVDAIGGQVGYLYNAVGKVFSAPPAPIPRPNPNAALDTAIAAVLADPSIDAKLKAVFTEMRKARGR